MINPCIGVRGASPDAAQTENPQGQTSSRESFCSSKGLNVKRIGCAIAVAAGVVIGCYFSHYLILLAVTAAVICVASFVIYEASSFIIGRDETKTHFLPIIGFFSEKGRHRWRDHYR